MPLPTVDAVKDGLFEKYAQAVADEKLARQDFQAAETIWDVARTQVKTLWEAIQQKRRDGEVAVGIYTTSKGAIVVPAPVIVPTPGGEARELMPIPSDVHALLPDQVAKV